MSAAVLILQIAILAASVLMVPLVLAHRSTGGLSSMLGGGMTASLKSSGVVQKNLHRLTVSVMAAWAGLIIALALLNR